MNAQSIPTSCALCGASALQFLESHSTPAQKYDLYQCAACAAQFWWPLKNPGATWYEHDVRYEGRNNDPILSPNEKHRGTIAFFGTNRGNVLDVGCGVGNFLAHAEEKGWQGAGIDFDHDGIEAAKQTFGLKDLEVADVLQYKERHPEKHFDLVTFFDVLEHIDNHNEFIETIKELLVSDGYIALSMPYRNGWRWIMQHDLPPRHLTRWDEESLGNFLGRHGFKIQHIRRLPASFYFLVIKLRFRYGKFATFGAVSKAKAATGTQQQAATSAPALRVRVIHALAKTKDILLFGIPAGIIWLLLLPTRKRYTDFYVVAQRLQQDEA